MFTTPVPLEPLISTHKTDTPPGAQVVKIVGTVPTGWKSDEKDKRVSEKDRRRDTSLGLRLESGW